MGVLLVGGFYFEDESLELDRRLAAGVAEGFYAALISGKDRLIENKDEQLRETETLVPARDRQVQQAETELARIKSSHS
jgi:uncharacterized protein (DUF3084 family)